MSEKPFPTVAALIRSALHYAIQDREDMVGCLDRSDPQRAIAQSKVDAFKAYLGKRFGELSRTDQDAADLASGKTRMIDIREIQPKGQADD